MDKKPRAKCAGSVEQMNVPTASGRVRTLFERDGGRCWLCNEPLQFDAKPNSGMATTVEHLLALSLGGPNKLSNLVLCHKKCNRILGCRPLTEKIELRERRLRKQWIASHGSK